MEMLTSNYEVMFVISKKNDSTQAKAIVEKLLDAIKPEELVIKTLAVESFAYPIKHEKSGYFFVATFRATNKNIGELNRLLKISGDVLRYLVINTDKNYGARPLKNEKKVKQAEVRARKYEEIRKQAEINEAKGILTPPSVDRSQSTPKRPKVLKSQKRYMRNSYRKIGIYTKNEDGEVVYELVAHAPKNNLKAKSGQPSEEAVNAQPTSVATATAENVTPAVKNEVTQPVVKEVTTEQVNQKPEVQKPAPVQEFPVIIEREITVPVEKVPPAVKSQPAREAKAESKVQPKLIKEVNEEVRVQPTKEVKPEVQSQPVEAVKVESEIKSVKREVKIQPKVTKEIKTEVKVEPKAVVKIVPVVESKPAPMVEPKPVKVVSTEAVVETKKVPRKTAPKTAASATKNRSTRTKVAEKVSSSRSWRTITKIKPTDLLSDSDGVFAANPATTSAKKTTSAITSKAKLASKKSKRATSTSATKKTKATLTVTGTAKKRATKRSTATKK